MVHLRRVLLALALSTVWVVVATGCRRDASCGVDIPGASLWVDTSDEAMTARLAVAQRCARSRGTHVLLEFVAPWCPDCVEMTRIEQSPEVARVLRDRYERVRVNVGNWDRHAALRERYGIDRIAAYVVLDAGGARVAQTVLEPVTGGAGPMTPARWIAWLEAPR
jgi:hypothetical protein